MGIKRLLAFLMLVLGIGLANASASASSCNVYAFGDSLSDIGKKSKSSMFDLSNKTEPPSKPYFNGRYSDGLVWVDYVKALACPAGQLTGYAAGGSFTDTRNLNVDIAPDAAGLAVQVDRAVADGVVFAADDIVLLWVGANDYIFDTISGNPPSPFDVVSNIVAAIQQLAGLGATTFVVPNMPALGNTPFAALADPTGEYGLAAGLNDLANGHNIILANTIDALNSSNLGFTVLAVDVHSTFDAILSHPEDFGFHNAQYPCLIQDELRNRSPSGLCPEQGNTYVAAGTVFWDLLHPTSSVHQLIAANAIGALSAAYSAQVASAP